MKVAKNDVVTVRVKVASTNKSLVGGYIMYKDVTPGAYALFDADCIVSNEGPLPPPEPMGVGAVVKDTEGETWVRIIEGPAQSPEVWVNRAEEFVPWADLLVEGPIEVLSAGLTTTPKD